MSLFRPEALAAQQTSALGRILLFTPRISTFLVAFICLVTVLLIAYSIRHFRQLYENASELPASTSRRSSTLPRQATPSTLVSSPLPARHRPGGMLPRWQPARRHRHPAQGRDYPGRTLPARAVNPALLPATPQLGRAVAWEYIYIHDSRYPVCKTINP